MRWWGGMSWWWRTRWWGKKAGGVLWWCTMTWWWCWCCSWCWGTWWCCSCMVMWCGCIPWWLIMMWCGGKLSWCCTVAWYNCMIWCELCPIAAPVPIDEIRWNNCRLSDILQVHINCSISNGGLIQRMLLQQFYTSILSPLSYPSPHLHSPPHPSLRPSREDRS